MSELPSNLRPNLLCIGAPKAGTTWLAQVLASHPDIYMPPQKELNALHYGDLDARLDEYAAYFRSAAERPVRCDFSVRYMASPLAPGAAARLAPDARLMAVLRNPVDQIQSHYWHLRRQNFHQAEPIRQPPDLFEALARFPDLLLEPALYGKHLERWLALFPRDRLLLIDYADLSPRTADVLAEICAFAEVKPFDFTAAMAETDTSDSRGGVQPRRGLLGAAFPILYVGVARGPYQWLKRTFGVRFGEALKRVLRLRQVSEAVFFKSGYPKLDADGRRRLYEVVREDIERLEAITGFRAGWAEPS